ncbi:DUF3618 domain-containing protein [Kitasatospora sp. NPDC096147]|uniref:DUF3618 domain-containing protein n=1 Tax=Kitasatospora sp. NPDC096147 TaxID=3364093 RepID=UPI003801B031
MSTQHRDHESAPAPERLREQIEDTRDELGHTIEALAGKADVKARLHEQAATVKERAAAKGARLTDRIQEAAGQGVHLLKDRTPDPVLDRAARAARRLRDMTARAARGADRTPDLAWEQDRPATDPARARRLPLLAGGAAVVVLLLAVRRIRRQR